MLRRPELAAVVRDSLLSFDGTRYEMHDFVIMPNHVHLLAVFPDEEAMLRQCESWKRYTAKQIHAALGQRGRFWQSDAFDHLIPHTACEDDFDDGGKRSCAVFFRSPACSERGGLIASRVIHPRNHECP